MIAVAEHTETAPASVAAEPKAAPVASKKAKSGKNATAAKKAPKGTKREKKGDSARDGSKASTILELLKRPCGASSKD